MPPSVPRKRFAEDDPPRAPKRQNATSSLPVTIPDSDSESSLSDVPSESTPQTPAVKTEPTENSDESDEDEDDDDDDAVDWEDAIEPNTPAPATAITTPAHVADLELTLDKNEVHIADIIDGKKAPSKIERQIRIQTHCLHVQFLLFHNALRNAWACDDKVHDILRRKLPAALHKEVKKWRVASGLEVPQPPPDTKKKGKQRRKSERDWAEEASRAEPGQPDMSRGDPIIPLLKVLAAYWKKQFKITAPGLRKQGYRPMARLEAEISSFSKDDHDPRIHGERIRDRAEFGQAAERMEGSRDLGAQLFTALLRALNIEARLVASLQPVGFGWTKAETYTPKPALKAETAPSTTEASATEDIVGLTSDSSDVETQSSQRGSNNPHGYDKDLPVPIYWTEVASPITHEIIPVDPLILRHPVATTPEFQAAFEPRGAKAEKAKQVICYVVAYSTDKTAKDVTTRYLRRRTWPGKTKGFRMPVEKIPVPGARGKFYEYDWFRVTLRIYTRAANERTAVDETEDTKDLLPNQPEKKTAREGDTLQSLRSSAEFVLERFLRREEALKPGAQPVRTFTSGKGAKAKQEDVYRRADVLKCLSAESWHKEGRQIKPGETPLKRVPIRAVTLLRKREVDELTRETGEKPKQGLYALYQTEWIIPPPIRDGVIPKNDYGNIDCFVPSMIPQGAAHIPWPGTVRLCKKLGIDYAEAVTGFEFGSKMAVPVIQGVVVAIENKDLLKDAWRADAAEKREKERRKTEARILQTWRKFLFGLRIAERVREEYGGSTGENERDAHNPFTSAAGRRRGGPAPPSSTAELPVRQASEEHEEQDEEPGDRSGGFLLPGEDEGEGAEPNYRGGGFLLPGEDDGDDGGLIVEKHQHGRPSLQTQSIPEQEPEGEDEPVSSMSSVEGLSSPPEVMDSEDPESDYEPPRTRRRTRNTRR